MFEIFHAVGIMSSAVTKQPDHNILGYALDFLIPFVLSTTISAWRNIALKATGHTFRTIYQNLMTITTIANVEFLLGTVIVFVLAYVVGRFILGNQQFPVLLVLTALAAYLGSFLGFVLISGFRYIDFPGLTMSQNLDLILATSIPFACAITAGYIGGYMTGFSQSLREKR